MKQHVSVANAVTSVSLTAGFLVLLIVPEHLALATVLVVLAAVLDGVDGPLARRAGGDRTFGAQLDSLADLLCFCVVPAFTMYAASHGAERGVGVVAACVFVLAGAWRLARFPLVPRQDHFVGLPTPAAGIALMLLVLWAPGVLVLVGAAVLSGLMISTLPFPKLPAQVDVVSPARRAGRRLRPRRPRRPFVPRVLRGTRRPGDRGPERPGRGRAAAKAGRRRAAARAGRAVNALKTRTVRRWARR